MPRSNSRLAGWREWGLPSLLSALLVSGPAATQVTDERILWSQECYGGIGAPAIGLDGTLYALDSGSGGGLWVLAPDGRILARTRIKGHSFAALLVGDQGSVYVVGDTTLGCDSNYNCRSIIYLHAFDRVGTELWRTPLLPEGRTWGSSSSPVISLGRKGDLLVGARGDSLVYAVSPDGALQWQLRLASMVHDLAVGPDGTIYVCVADGVYALTPGGQLLWRWLSDRYIGWGQMVIGSDGGIIVPSRYMPSLPGPAVLYAVDPQGSLRGQVNLEDSPGLYSSPAIDAEGNILFLEPPFADQPMAMSVLRSVTNSGESYWRMPLESSGFSQLAVGADETIYVLGDDNQHAVLYALDSVGGRERWQIRFGIGGSPRFTLSAKGVLYLPMGNYLYAIQTDSPGLADSPWPMPRHDPRNTGRVSGPATAVLEISSERLPTACRLGSSYPNPFNAGTVIPFELPAAGPAEVRVYDLLGQEVALLAKGWFTAGRHQVRWEPQGQGSAVYLCRLTTINSASVQRLVLVK